MITKKFGVDFHSGGGALTLNPFDVADDPVTYGELRTKTHASGGTITPEAVED